MDNTVWRPGVPGVPLVCRDKKKAGGGCKLKTSKCHPMYHHHMSAAVTGTHTPALGYVGEYTLRGTYPRTPP
eukprot:3477772-Pleurochrysis_carterae.AAC.1